MSSLTVIPYYVKDNYGTRTIYIATHISPDICLLAKHLQRLTGRKTLTPGDMDALAGLGYELQQVLPPSR